MPHSRCFREDELPSGIVVERRTAIESFDMMFARLSKSDRERFAQYPDRERCKIWFMWRSRFHPENPPMVRDQLLSRSVGEQYWYANDTATTWMGKIEGTPWFATREEAESFFATMEAADG